jgi:H+-translocating NAD(P) transhydrogenase subunit alpha
MIIGVVKETYPGEDRVALVPANCHALKKAGLEVVMQSGAGQAAGFPDEQFANQGVKIVDERKDVFESADLMAQVRTLGANPEVGRADLDFLKAGNTVVGMMEPLSEFEAVKALAEKGVNGFSLELMPRITRAQSMDVLSSMASIAGYKSVLIAANTLPRMFPMMMTAAGTVAPAKVFIIGAGVAGLQAIATAKRLGAVVHSFDVRAAVKEQVQSLGAKFVEFDLGLGDAEDKGGYAKELTEEQKRKQQELMADVVAESDVVITTAAVPGRKAPVLIEAQTVRRMKPGSVIVDLAAERGGNCELTEKGKVVEVEGVRILGPENLPAQVPFHASQMFGKNMLTFLQHLIVEGQLKIDTEDEITRQTLVVRDGQVVHEQVKSLMA